MLQDLSDAFVSIWEAGERPGAELVNEPGTLCWNDLMTHDVPKAIDFYREVFGWEMDAVEGAPGNRQSIRVGKTLNGGIAEIPEQMSSQMPPHTGWPASPLTTSRQRARQPFSRAARSSPT